MVDYISISWLRVLQSEEEGPVCVYEHKHPFYLLHSQTYLLSVVHAHTISTPILRL